MRNIAEKVLIRAILTIAVLLVRLFNELDEGPVDYRIIEVPIGNAYDPRDDETG